MHHRHRVFIAAALSACAGQVAGAGETRRGPALREVIVVFKTHFDIGYTDMPAKVLEIYRTTMMDKALAVYEETKTLPPEHRFVWTVPGWPLTKILGPEQTPERRERVEAMIRDGRLVWHALACTTHTESLEAEELVRSLRFSSALSRRYSQPLPRDAKMTDVPSHSWILPTVLAHAGIDFLHLGCNSASTPPDVPPLFWWEGPDGSRVLTMQSRTYGSGLLPPRDWPHKTWLALIHTGDNHGPPSAKDVRDLLAEAERDLPGVKVRMGRLSDFGDAIRAEKPDLPVIRADMPDTWIHGIMSMPQETALARGVRPRIAALEALDTLLGAWGVARPDLGETVARAYEQTLLFGEHTWGMATAKFGPRLYGDAWSAACAKGTYAKLEESWREKGAYARRAADLVEPAIRERMQALANGVKVDGPRIVVFNPLPWRRHELVVAKVPAGTGELRDLRSGERVPIDAEGRFIARKVPGLGYLTYVPVAGDEPPTVTMSGGVLENVALQVELDARRGGIRSLYHKRSGRELIDSSAPFCLGQYLYQRFDASEIDAFVATYVTDPVNWAIWDFAKPDLPRADKAPHRDASPGPFELRMHHGPVIESAELRAPSRGGVPHATTLRVTLPRALGYMELEWSIEGKKPDPWPEAGWLCLPFAASDPLILLERAGGAVDPAKDLQRASNHQVFCLGGGLAVSDKSGVGVVVCPLDAPLASIGNPGIFRYTSEWTPRKPHVFINLFNNAWSTNFQQWIGGSWSSQVRMWARGDAGPAKPLAMMYSETRRPCLVATADGPGGRLPVMREVMSFGHPVTALGPNPDGEGLVMRFWSGDRSSQVRLPEGLRPSRVQQCDLRGRPVGEPIPVKDGTLELRRPGPGPITLQWVP